MHESIDWPRKHPPRRRLRFLLILAVLAGMVFGGRTALSYYVDVLWFGSLGRQECWPGLSALQYSSLLMKSQILQK